MACFISMTLITCTCIHCYSITFIYKKSFHYLYTYTFFFLFHIEYTMKYAIIKGLFKPLIILILYILISCDNEGTSVEPNRLNCIHDFSDFFKI